MKNVRQNEILKIVQTKDIETQEQLLEELKTRGYTTTQATIARFSLCGLLRFRRHGYQRHGRKFSRGRYRNFNNAGQHLRPAV